VDKRPTLWRSSRLTACGIALSILGTASAGPPVSSLSPLPGPAPAVSNPSTVVRRDQAVRRSASVKGVADPPTGGSATRIATAPYPPTLLDPNVRPIDLGMALRLAGVQNPQLMIARQRVVEATALRQLAAAQLLPSLNLGTNYDSHTGALQQSNGNILSVQRSALYVGAGSNAVAAGTVNIPGVVLTGNVAVGLFGFLTSRQVVIQREFATIAIRNQVFLETTTAYCELLRAEGRRAVGMQVRDEAKRIAELTANYASAGQGRDADAHRAATELASREADVQAAEGAVLVASARLCYVLNLDPSLRLHPTDAFVVPQPIIPDPMPLAELIAISLLRRPELGERRAAFREALLALQGTKLLPFSPTILVGFSAGGFGGGSNLVRPVFGAFGGRTDLDAYTYWTLQNFGVGNAALIRTAKARLGLAEFQQIAVLDQVRAEVAEAYARTHARYAQIGTTERAVRSGTLGLREDLVRIENEVTPAIETVNSLDLLARARYGYLDAIVDYNRAQFELFVALGQPPADALAHPVPVAGVTPPGNPMTVTGERMAPRLSPTPTPNGRPVPDPGPSAAVPGRPPAAAPVALRPAG